MLQFLVINATVAEFLCFASFMHARLLYSLGSILYTDEQKSKEIDKQINTTTKAHPLKHIEI